MFMEYCKSCVCIGIIGDDEYATFIAKDPKTGAIHIIQGEDADEKVAFFAFANETKAREAFALYTQLPCLDPYSDKFGRYIMEHGAFLCPLVPEEIDRYYYGHPDTLQYVPMCFETDVCLRVCGGDLFSESVRKTILQETQRR